MDYAALWEEVLSFDPRTHQQQATRPSEGEASFLNWISNNQERYFGANGIYSKPPGAESSRAPTTGPSPNLADGAPLARGGQGTGFIGGTSLAGPQLNGRNGVTQNMGEYRNGLRDAQMDGIQQSQVQVSNNNN